MKVSEHIKICDPHMFFMAKSPHTGEERECCPESLKWLESEGVDKPESKASIYMLDIKNNWDFVRNTRSALVGTEGPETVPAELL